LLLPTERPPLALDVKRALLLFDQVHITNPDDRELVEPAAFTSTLTPIPMPVFFANDGPVLPLGKLPGYDAQFGVTLEDCDAAVLQGSLVVRPAPQLMTSGFGLGAPPTPQGWAPPGWVVGAFRSLVAQAETLRAACHGLPHEARLRQFDLDAIAPGGRALAQGMGGPPIVANINDGSLPPDIAVAVQKLAAARLGSAVKCIGLCQNLGLHPCSNDTGMAALLDLLQRSSQKALTSVLEGHGDDDLLRRAMRVERLAIGHELLDATLADLSIDDVLRLRTKAWGRAGQARTAFFAAVRRLSEEEESDEAFDSAVQKAIEEYRKATRDLQDEWKKLSYKAAIATGSAAAGGVVQSLLALPWSLAIGIMGAGAALINGVPEIVSIMRKKKDLAGGAGKALVAPFAFALEK
jgi:hypothetical protein